MTRDEILERYAAGERCFRDADLRGADLCRADLCRADLCGARYAVTAVLMARWGDVSPDLCRDLMRLDASALPDGEAAMQAWADGGQCPLDATGKGRVANFQERGAHWSAGPVPSLWDLWVRLAAEKGVKIAEEEG